VSRDIIFIADYFLGDFLGGAEMANEELISLLSASGHPVEKILCRDVTPQYITKNKDKYFIVSNFMTLGGNSKEALIDLGCHYILFEHDHKYVVNRNPGVFPDYKAPEDFIVFRELYENAVKVVCQSKLHEEVMKKNLNILNTVNAGCSLWSEEYIDWISNLEINKTKNAAIMRSDNAIKNQSKSESYCREKNLEYELLSSPDPRQFIQELAKFEYLVFFPGVLETLSRVAIEAKVVGCKLITNQLLGVASEDWFKEDRNTIIQTMRDARKTVPQIFLNAMDQKKKDTPSRIPKNAGITVILNSYRRPYNLEMQIEAIRKQSIQPTQIWLWVNQHEDNTQFDHSKLDVDRIFDNDHNWKFYGRFAAALLADTEYIAIFDDDTVPGDKWFENCLDNMRTDQGIQGSAGIILKNNQYYMQHDRCGWPTQNSQSQRVDLVGHAWFFKRDWLHYLWREKPFTWDNGEDIQFSYLAQKYGGINTYCPPHPHGDISLHGSTKGNELGIDSKATSTNQAISHQQFFHERDLCIQNAINNGWETVLGLKS
jgi:hypothetical protein